MVKISQNWPKTVKNFVKIYQDLEKIGKFMPKFGKNIETNFTVNPL